MFDDADNVRGMASACTFGMIGMDCAVLEGANSLLDEA
jgi:hypothetical protein